jgi:hypothetical protein
LAHPELHGIDESKIQRERENKKVRIVKTATTTKIYFLI